MNDKHISCPSHCCKNQCKYSYEDCPVVNGDSTCLGCYLCGEYDDYHDIQERYDYQADSLNLQGIDNLIAGLLILRPYMNEYTCVNEHADWLTVFQYQGEALQLIGDDRARLLAKGWTDIDDAWDCKLPT